MTQGKWLHNANSIPVMFPQFSVGVDCLYSLELANLIPVSNFCRESGDKSNQSRLNVELL